MFLFLLLLAATGTAPVATVPLDLSTGRPMVQMMVNGQGPYPFIFDTGSPSLLVTQALVDELELPVLRTTEMVSPVGGTPVQTFLVHVDSLTLGDVPAKDLEAMVLNLSGAGLGMGVVGPAIFRDHGPLTLDFASNTLTMGKGSPAGVETWIPFGASAPLLDVPLRIGESRMDGHVDTGSPGILTVRSRIFRP